MKSFRSRLAAILTVCAIGLTCSACGKSDSSSSDSSDSSASLSDDASSSDDASGSTETLSSEEVEALQKQDMVIYDYDVEDEESANVPINENTNSDDSDSSSDDENEESYVIVTDENGEEATDENGSVVTEIVDNSSSSSSSSDSSNNASDSSTSSSASDDASSSDSSSDNSDISSDSSSNDDSEDSYTSSIAGKLVYWLNMSSGDQTFNGDFIDVTFKVKEDIPDGNYEIGIGTCDFANYAAETITYASTNGYVTVGDAVTPTVETEGDGTIQLACESVMAQQGDEITIRFTMQDNPGIVALIFRFTYDQNALEYVSYDVGADCADYIDLAS